MESPLFDGHFQVALGERNEEVQALSAQASAQTLAHGVRFGRPYRCSQYSHTHSLHASVQVLGKVVLQSCHMDCGGVLIIFRDAKITAAFVQMATLRTCGDYLCGGVVSAIFPVLS